MKKDALVVLRLSSAAKMEAAWIFQHIVMVIGSVVMGVMKRTVALKLDLPVDLGNSDVMMVPVSRRVTNVMMFQTVEMVVMNKTVMANLMAMGVQATNSDAVMDYAYLTPSSVMDTTIVKTTLMRLDVLQDVLTVNLNAGTEPAYFLPRNAMVLLTVWIDLMSLIVQHQLPRHVLHMNLHVKMEAA